MAGNPCRHTSAWRRSHEFRDYVGVQDELHGQSKVGGGDIGSLGGTSKSTPPSGANRSRIASAKLRGVVLLSPLRLASVRSKDSVACLVRTSGWNRPPPLCELRPSRIGPRTAVAKEITTFAIGRPPRGPWDTTVASICVGTGSPLRRHSLATSSTMTTLASFPRLMFRVAKYGVLVRQVLALRIVSSRSSSDTARNGKAPSAPARKNVNFLTTRSN